LFKSVSIIYGNFLDFESQIEKNLKNSAALQTTIDIKILYQYMTKEEHQHLIDTILKQQESILKLKEKIGYLHTIIDTLGRELERCRRDGRI